MTEQQQKIAKQKQLKKNEQQQECQEIELKQNMVLFKYKRQANQCAFNEIGFQKEKPKKLLKKEQPMKQIVKMIKNINVKKQEQQEYYLKRVKVQNTLLDKKIRQMVWNKSQQNRKQIRDEKFSQQRGQDYKMKIIELKSHVLDFHGKKVYYENLEEEEGFTIEDYYLLQKGLIHRSQGCPRIMMPSEVKYLIENEQEQQNNSSLIDSSDSNREDHPDYDYPEQDYSSSQEDIIPIQNDYQDQQDDQEVYRRYKISNYRYLKRCKNKKYREQQLPQDQWQQHEY